MKEDQFLIRPQHFDKGRFLFPLTFAVDVGGQTVNSSLLVGGPARLHLGVHDIAIAHAQFPNEQEIGECEKNQRAQDEESGVPEIEPQAEAEVRRGPTRFPGGCRGRRSGSEHVR
jgi:hypothetical protein